MEWTHFLSLVTMWFSNKFRTAFLHFNLNSTEVPCIWIIYLRYFEMACFAWVFNKEVMPIRKMFVFDHHSSYRHQNPVCWSSKMTRHILLHFTVSLCNWENLISFRIIIGCILMKMTKLTVCLFWINLLCCSLSPKTKDWSVVVKKPTIELDYLDVFWNIKLVITPHII